VPISSVSSRHQVTLGGGRPGEQERWKSAQWVVIYISRGKAAARFQPDGMRVYPFHPADMHHPRGAAGHGGLPQFDGQLASAQGMCCGHSSSIFQLGL